MCAARMFEVRKPGEIIDRYRIEAEIGRGGMGHVYRAYDSRLRRVIALKVMNESLSPEGMTRLVREARLTASLSHPNIVAVFDVGDHEGLPYMAMELVEGRQLRHALRAPVSIEEKLRWLADIARGLDAAHRAGVIHRDVKPQNVMVTSSCAKILDFGIAKELDDAARKRTALLPSLQTQPGYAMGTPQYMAPEVLRGESPSDARTDQFSWGMLAYELFAGRPAKRDDIERGVRWKPPSLEGLHLPPRVASVIERTLAVDPDDRFSSLADVAGAIDATSSPLPRTAPQPAAAEPIEDRAIGMPTRLFAVKTPKQVKTASIRDPSRALLQPFADAALADLGTAVPNGFKQAVVIVTLDVEKGKARFFAQLVATDEHGDLWTPEASMDLVRAAGTLIAEDARDGNGRWQRLVVKLIGGSRKPIVVDVQ
jgi:serine/threonine protein kinase